MRTLGLLVVLAAACSSSSSSSSFTQPDASPRDAGSDAACTTDAGAGLLCPALRDCPLDGGASFCAADLAAAHAISPCAVAATGQHLGFASCGAYEEMSIGGIDTGELTYFDVATGARVAVVDYASTSRGCAGGPSCFTVPACQAPQPVACDGDAGSSDASGPAADSGSCLSWSVVSWPGPSATNLATGDFDGDGRLDVVTVDSQGAVITTLLGAGGGAPGATRTTPNGTGQPGQVAAGDFDEDGALDLVVLEGQGSASPFQVSLFRGHGDGTFAAPSTVTIDGYFGGLLVALDVDGDGHLDLLHDDSPHLDVLLGRGDGTFGSPVQSTERGGNASSLCAADLDGDGHLDVARNQAPAPLGVLLGKGNGSFGKEADYGFADALGIACADFDEDGRADVVTGTSPGGLFFRGLGGGRMASPVAFAGAAGVIDGVASSDLDGDGHADLVLLAGVKPDGGALSAYAVLSALGHGDGTFATPAPVGVTYDWLPFAVVDVDGDHRPDVVGTMAAGGVGIALQRGCR